MSQEGLWGNLPHQGGGWVSIDHTAAVTIPLASEGCWGRERGNLERQTKGGGLGFSSSRPSALSSVLLLTFSLLCQLFCAHLGC